MSILHVRFGTARPTTTPAASMLICAAAKYRRRTPELVEINNVNYEGDWDADITSESAETVAHQVVRVWPESWIEEDEEDEEDES